MAKIRSTQTKRTVPNVCSLRENAWKDQLGKWRTAIDYEITREEFFAMEGSS